MLQPSLNSDPAAIPPVALAPLLSILLTILSCMDFILKGL